MKIPAPVARPSRPSVRFVAFDQATARIYRGPASGFGITGISTGLTVGCAQIGYALSGSNHTKITMATGSYEVTDAGYSGDGDAMAKITATATGTLTVANSTNLA